MIGCGISCLISGAIPPRLLGLPPGRVGGGGDGPAGLPEGAGEAAGATAQPLDPDGGEEPI
jgi:hypothetical protein